MKTIGLIGGIASGKSAVAAELGKLGAIVLDADAAVREQFGEPEVRQLLVRRWGEDILDEAGEPRRGKIAAKIFVPDAGGESDRRWIESILHPRVRRRFEAEIERLRQSDCPAVVLDVPLLLEARWQSMCDELLWVECPEETRRARADARGWPAGEFDRREAAQMPIEQKRAHATWTVDTSGPIEELAGQIRQFWRERIVPSAAC